MSYPVTGNEVYVCFTISNIMLEGLGRSTITREPVSADYLKKLFARYGVKISAKPEHRGLLERVNEVYDLGLDIPENMQILQLSEKNRRLVVINVGGVRRKNGSLLPDYTEDDLREATFGFDKFYVQSRHYDDIVSELETLKKDYELHVAWSDRIGEE